jgi:hypothetical protein
VPTADVMIVGVVRDRRRERAGRHPDFEAYQGDKQTTVPPRPLAPMGNPFYARGAGRKEGGICLYGAQTTEGRLTSGYGSP